MPCVTRPCMTHPTPGTLPSPRSSLRMAGPTSTPGWVFPRLIPVTHHPPCVTHHPPCLCDSSPALLVWPAWPAPRFHTLCNSGLFLGLGGPDPAALGRVHRGHADGHDAAVRQLRHHWPVADSSLARRWLVVGPSLTHRWPILPINRDTISDPDTTHHHHHTLDYHPACAPWGVPCLGENGRRMLIGACDPMLCPIWGYRAEHGAIAHFEDSQGGPAHTLCTPSPTHCALSFAGAHAESWSWGLRSDPMLCPTPGLTRAHPDRT